MTLSDISSIVGVISGLAVLGSLFYLSLQNRQMERNQRALINQGAMARDTAIVGMLRQPDFAAAWVKVLAGQTDFTSLEVWHLSVVMRGLLGSLQETYLQKKTGLIDQITIDYVELGVRYFMAQPVCAALWSTGKAAYPTETVLMVESLIAHQPPAQPVDLGEALKLALGQRPH
jgi:hypothetical protein